MLLNLWSCKIIFDYIIGLAQDRDNTRSEPYVNMNTESNLPTIIVPARLASSRFPEKLIQKVEGKPLILWTAERIKKIAPEFELFFAVDGKELKLILEDAGFSSIQTDPDLASGTDRIAAANLEIKASSVINVQADEPLVERKHIDSLVTALLPNQTSMSTLAVPFTQESDFLDPNQVKVILDSRGYAMYFSRAPIPFYRDAAEMWETKVKPLKHIGLYGYKASFLEQFCSEKAGRLEEIEKLEQLRALEWGAKISVSVVHSPTIGIDSPEDLIKFETHIHAR